MDKNILILIIMVAAMIGFVVIVMINGNSKNSKEQAEAARAARDMRLAKLKPVMTKILMTNNTGSVQKSSMTSAAGRAAIGGFVAGIPGAIAGAATTLKYTKETNTTTFKVWYADGHTEIQTAVNGGHDWKKYMELLEDGDER